MVCFNKYPKKKKRKEKLVLKSRLLKDRKKQSAHKIKQQTEILKREKDPPDLPRSALGIHLSMIKRFRLITECSVCDTS